MLKRFSLKCNHLWIIKQFFSKEHEKTAILNQTAVQFRKTIHTSNFLQTIIPNLYISMNCLILPLHTDSSIYPSKIKCTFNTVDSEGMIHMSFTQFRLVQFSSDQNNSVTLHTWIPTQMLQSESRAASNYQKVHPWMVYPWYWPHILIPISEL